MHLGVYMDIKMVKFEKTKIGWDIVFNVNLTEEESSKFNIDKIKYVGDYDIKKESNLIVFSFSFDEGELEENETIEKRLDIIKKDIMSLNQNCLS